MDDRIDGCGPSRVTNGNEDDDISGSQPPTQPLYSNESSTSSEDESSSDETETNAVNSPKE